VETQISLDPQDFRREFEALCRKGATEAKHARLHFDGVGFRATQDRRLTERLLKYQLGKRKENQQQ